MTAHAVKSLPTSATGAFQQWLRGRLSTLTSSVVLTGAGLLAVFILLLALIQFATPDLAGNDGYYHIKIAQVMREQGLRPAFPWLPLTVLNPAAYVDHHFLYHIFLIPFTFGDLRVGAKWASVILPALTFLSGWLFLRSQRVSYATLWAIGFFAVSEAFLYRMSMPRAQSVSLLMLIVGLHLTLTGRYRWLLPLSFLYVWLYDAFPLMLILVGTYVGARLLLEGKLDLKPLLYSGLGIMLGLLINPYFPENLLFIYHHLLPKLTDATATSVGKEWYPYQTWTLVENSGPALLLFVSAIFALGLRERRINTATATLLFLTVLFGFMLFKSRRFIEYFPAFVLLFGALAWAPLFKAWMQAKKWVGRDLPVVLTVIVLLASAWNIQQTQASLKDSKPFQRFATASTWLVTNTPARSMVFQTDWDDFTRLYYYNTHNIYTVGLDPTYMQLYDADLYDLWIEISKGRVERPAATIAGKFGAGYVITDLQHKGFLREAEADPQLIERYRDDFAVVFEVVAQKEVPQK